MDERRKRFAELLGQAPITPKDQETMANTPRNWLADKVNPLLEQYVNPVLPEALEMAIPKMTVADEKQYLADLPEMMAGATMGSVKKTRPGANVFGPKPEVGTVRVIPTAADKALEKSKEALKEGSKKVGETAQANRARFDELFGPESKERMAEASKSYKQTLEESLGKSLQEISDELGSFKSEQMGKIRRGEL